MPLIKDSGVTSIGQGGQSPPRFSGVNTTLIGGVVSIQEFCRFVRVSASPLPNPSYAPERECEKSEMALQHKSELCIYKELNRKLVLRNIWNMSKELFLYVWYHLILNYSLAGPLDASFSLSSSALVMLVAWYMHIYFLFHSFFTDFTPSYFFLFPCDPLL